MRIVIAAIATLVVLAGTALAGGPQVFFDESHREPFRIGQNGELGLSGLAETLRASGLTVSPLGRISGDSLSGGAALVVSGPFAAFSGEEAETVARFVEGGGKLVVMIHVASPVVPLLHRLGVAVSNGVVHEGTSPEGKGTEFPVRTLTSHPLTAGVEEFVVRGGWALLGNEKATAVASTSGSSWVDLNGDGERSARDAGGPFGMVVAGRAGRGSFAVFGDDAIFQNRFLVGGNLQLAKNLALWLREKN